MKLTLKNLKIQDECTFFDLIVDNALAAFVRVHNNGNISTVWSSTKDMKKGERHYTPENYCQIVRQLVLTHITPLLTVLQDGIKCQRTSRK